MTVSVVTGSNSGIGRAIALHLAKAGHRVVATMRTPAKGEKLLSAAQSAGVTVEIVALDVTDDESVRNAFDEIGPVDILVNNAGVAGNAVVEECPIDLYRSVMEANVYGPVRCIQAVLPHMRERKSGCIVNITSVAGRIASLAQAPYVASKWAFEGVSEELAQEVAPFGIRVVIVEPGVTKSAIFAKNVDAPNSTGAYDEHYARMFQFYAAGIPQATPAEEVAAIVLQAATTERPQLRYLVSWAAAEMAEGRARMSDEDWVAMGAADTKSYYQRFRESFGLDITPAGA